MHAYEEKTNRNVSRVRFLHSNEQRPLIKSDSHGETSVHSLMIMGPLARARARAFIMPQGCIIHLFALSRIRWGTNSRWDYYRIGTGPETGREKKKKKKKNQRRAPDSRLRTAPARHRMASTRHISIDIYVYTCNLRRGRFLRRLSTGSYFPVRQHGCRLSLVIVGRTRLLTGSLHG